MMNNCEDYIDEFLDSQLSADDQISFQERIEGDQNFMKDVDFHRVVRASLVFYGGSPIRESLNAIEEELDQEGFFSSDEEKEILQGLEKVGKKDFSDVVSEVDQELSREKFYSDLTKESTDGNARVFSLGGRKGLYAVAASVAILIVSTVVFWSLPQTSLDLYQKNFVAMSDLITDEIKSEKEEVGFVTDDAALDSLANAMQLYRDERYLAFISSTDLLIDDQALGHYRSQISLYRGIAFLERKLYKDAEQAFNLSKHPEADWYLMLTFLAQNEPDRAKSHFGELENPDQKIRKLMDEL